MKIKLGTLRQFFRETLLEQAWVPGRWMPGEGEPVSPEDVEKLGGMEEADARTMGDDAGPGELPGDYDMAEHLRSDEEGTSLGDAVEESVKEAAMINREIKRYLREQDDGTDAGPTAVKGFYTPFDMNKDHMGTDDVSATWYRSPGRDPGTDGDPYRGEDPYAQIGMHPADGSTNPPGAAGDSKPLAPPIWQLGAGGDTSAVLGANAKPATPSGAEDGTESDEEESEGETDEEQATGSGAGEKSG